MSTESAGEVLRARPGAAEDQDTDAEQQRQADVQTRPDRGLTQRRRVGRADVEDEVEQQQGGDAHHREERGVGGIEEPAGHPPDQGPLDHERDEQTPDTAPGHGGDGGERAQRGQGHDDGDAPLGVESPAQ